jgi:hypothetical protein
MKVTRYFIGYKRDITPIIDPGFRSASVARENRDELWPAKTPIWKVTTTVTVTRVPEPKRGKRKPASAKGGGPGA